LNSWQLVNRALTSLKGIPIFFASSFHVLLRVGQELVKRRIEGPNCDRITIHRPEDPDKIGPLQFEQRGERPIVEAGRAGKLLFQQLDLLL
jgi:hypothetical protein